MSNMCNGYNERCGFQDNEDSDEEETAKNQRANYLMHKRLKIKPFPGRPSMSSELKRTTIPQAVGKFIDRRSRTACALGVLQLGANGEWTDKQPSWYNFNHTYNMYEEETERQVRCPGKFGSESCGKRDCLMATIFHLNDVHKTSNKEIGKWLKEKYNL